MADPPEVRGPLSAGALRAALAEHAARADTENPRTRFCGIELRNEHLPGLRARDADFVDCDFSATSLAGGDFSGATFTNVAFQQTDLTGATLIGATFDEDCVLSPAILKNAVAGHAAFLGCSLEDADAEGANFEHAMFTGAMLTGARFDRTDLRGAQGLVFDRTSVRGAVFAPDAADDWSRLRRNYTGARFLLTMLALLVFVGVLAAKAFALYGIALIETAAIPDRAALLAGAASADSLIEAYCRQEGATCRTTSLWRVLLGFTDGYFAATYVLLSIAYNAARFVMTVSVAGMRDEEERSGRTPHRIARPQARKGIGGWIEARCTACRVSYGWLLPVDRFLGWYRWVVLAAFLGGVVDIALTPIVLPG